MRGGYTLVEVLCALVVAAVLAVAVSSIAFAMSNAHAQSEQHFKAIQNSRAVLGRLEDQLRKAKLVLGVSSGALSFWAGDFNGDGGINDDEIVVVSLNANTGTLEETRVLWESGLDQALRELLNIGHTLNDVVGVASCLSALDCNMRRRTNALAQDVVAFSARVTDAPPMSRSVSIELVTRMEQRDFTARTNVTLRADRTSSVAISQNQWVLKP
jgi:prepilin-type N-terminal cleavage/methylation domain-containing protein